MPEYKRIIQRTTNSNRIESGNAELEVNELVIVQDTDDIGFYNRNKEFIYTNKDRFKVNNLKELENTTKFKIGDIIEVLGKIMNTDGETTKYYISNSYSSLQLKNGLYAHIIQNNFLDKRLKTTEKNIALAINENYDGIKKNKNLVDEQNKTIELIEKKPIIEGRFSDNSISSKKLKISTDEDKIKLENLSEEVKKAMSGQTQIGPDLSNNSITREKVANGAIDYSKIYKAKLGKNIFDSSEISVSLGSYINNTNGVIVNQGNENYSCIETFIPVEENITYYTNKLIAHGAWYDKNKNFISSNIIDGNGTSSIVSPTNAKFLRFSSIGGENNIEYFKNKFMISTEKITEYEEYSFTVASLRAEPISVKSKHIEKNSIENKHIEKISHEKLISNVLENGNIFDPNQIIRHNYYVSNVDGTLLENEKYYTSDFIKINELKEYFSNHQIRMLAFYDENYSFISGLEYVDSFITPSFSKYILITFGNDIKLDNIFFGETKSKYGAYGFKLKSYFNNLENLKFSTNNLIVKDLLLENKAIDNNSGNVVNIADEYKTRYTTWFTEVDSSLNYFVSECSRIAFYDKNHNFISMGSAITIPGIYSLYMPENTKYIRLTSVQNSNINNLYLGRKNERTQLNDNKLLTENLTEYEKSSNLYDNSNKCINGFYVNCVTGLLQINENYKSSYFIEINENTNYIHSLNNIRMLAFYDKDYNFISGLEDLKNTIQTPSSVKYMRLTFYISEDLSSFRLNKGNILKNYEPFDAYRLKNLRISSEHILEEEISNEKIDVYLPPEIHVAVGREIDIYNKNISNILNINDYFFEWVCSKGINTNRKFSIKPTQNDIGTYTLNLNIYDKDYKLVKETSTKLIILSNVITRKKTVLCIGDSLTNDKPWYNEWKTLSNDMITFVGTRGTSNKHEGRSGYTSTGYVTDSGYGYQGNFKIKVTNIITENPQLKKQYYLPLVTGVNEVFEVEEIKIEDGATWIYMNRIGGNGGEVKANGQAIAINTSVPGDNNIAYTDTKVTSKNPFWNPATSEIDFNYYSNTYGISKPDIVQIWLGANETVVGTSVDDISNTLKSTTIKNVKTLVNKILIQWPGTKIMIVLNQYWADQSGMTNSYGASNKNNNLKQRTGVFSMNKSFIEEFYGYNDDLFICPAGLLLDSEFNYPFKEVNINPRNSSVKERYYLDSVHPSVEGYLQIADSLFSTYSHICNKEN